MRIVLTFEVVFCYKPIDVMKYLSANPKIMGGHLVIKNTRIPIEVIFYHLSNGYSLEEIHNMWSYVDYNQLKCAVQEAAGLLSQNIHAKSLL